MSVARGVKIEVLHAVYRIKEEIRGKTCNWSFAFRSVLFAAEEMIFQWIKKKKKRRQNVPVIGSIFADWPWLSRGGYENERSDAFNWAFGLFVRVRIIVETRRFPPLPTRNKERFSEKRRFVPMKRKKEKKQNRWKDDREVAATIIRSPKTTFAIAGAASLLEPELQLRSNHGTIKFH